MAAAAEVVVFYPLDVTRTLVERDREPDWIKVLHQRSKSGMSRLYDGVLLAALVEPVRRVFRYVNMQGNRRRLSEPSAALSLAVAASDTGHLEGLFFAPAEMFRMWQQLEPDDAVGGVIGTAARGARWVWDHPTAFVLTWVAICARHSVWNFTYSFSSSLVVDFVTFLVGSKERTVLHGALTASVASVFASLAAAPIDTIKVRLMAESPSLKRLYPWAADIAELEAPSLLYGALPLIPRALLGAFFNAAAYDWLKDKPWAVMQQYNTALPYFIHLFVRKMIYITYPVQLVIQLMASPTSIGYTFWNFFEVEKEWNPQ